jgi:hypothetical protein
MSPTKQHHINFCISPKALYHTLGAPSNSI